MKNQKTQNLPLDEDEFDAIARQQSKKFPDLLLFRDEEGIIDDFYEFYGRRRRYKIDLTTPPIDPLHDMEK